MKAPVVNFLSPFDGQRAVFARIVDTLSHGLYVRPPQRPIRYECKRCSRQFTVTTKTALHATKLPLSTWLLAMYLICNSSKGIASTILAKLIGTTQPTAWKLGHTIRNMMNSSHSDTALLSGIIELDEKYVGGKPVKTPGIVHKRGKGTSKQ